MKQLILLFPVLWLLACQPATDQTDADKAEDQTSIQSMPGKELLDLFEEVNVVKMHLFATGEEDPDPEEYPYTGKEITGDVLEMLGNNLQPDEDGGAYACYKTENSGHYILRVSNDIVLAVWNSEMGKLKKVAHLAFLLCEDGACHQQDSWLTDLDDNRTLELVVRNEKRDAAGNVTEENFTVLTDNGNGMFGKTSEQLASLAVKDNYVMH